LIATSLLSRAFEFGIELIPLEVRANLEQRFCRALDRCFRSARERYLRNRIRELRLPRSVRKSRRSAQRSSTARPNRAGRSHRSRSRSAGSRKKASDDSDPDPGSIFSSNLDSSARSARGAP